MRKRANFFLMVGAVAALQALLPTASLAIAGDDPGESARQESENHWVPSLAIIGGATIQDQEGSADSLLSSPIGADPVPLRPSAGDDDVSVAPFVGGSLELMTPALPLPTRPRLFVSGEILPTFASERNLAGQGDPDCVRGPEIGAPCATDEVPGERSFGFGEDAANGVGTATDTQVDTLVYGANLGVAFPLQVGKRQLRIKPSVGWIQYEVEATGTVVNAACDPESRCTDITNQFGFVFPGFLRQPEKLNASASQSFNGIGPGLDIEMDAGRFGPLGVSLFLGGRAYRILGDRTISFGASQAFDDQIGTDLETVQFEVEVDPWMYRAHVGIRFLWLGSRD